MSNLSKRVINWKSEEEKHWSSALHYWSWSNHACLGKR